MRTAAQTPYGFPGFTQQTIRTSAGVDIAVRQAGTGPAVLLIHGFPQNGYTWRHVAVALAANYTVVVPDYRGAGESSTPADGYDKHTMALDLHDMLHELGIERAHIVGHDIGMMVAYAYAQQFPDELITLAMLDAVIPGTEHFRNLVAMGRSWHFGFHKQVQLATRLISGREDVYFDWIYDNFTVDGSAIPLSDRAYYTELARRPGVLEANIKSYAAFDDDAIVNAELLKQHRLLAMPVLLAGGAQSLGPYLAPLAEEIAERAEVFIVDGAGHFLPEEKPERVTELLRQLFQRGAES